MGLRLIIHLGASEDELKSLLETTASRLCTHMIEKRDMHSRTCSARLLSKFRARRRILRVFLSGGLLLAIVVRALYDLLEAWLGHRIGARRVAPDYSES